MKKTRTIKNEEEFIICDFCKREKYAKEDYWEMCRVFNYKNQELGYHFDAHEPCLELAASQTLNKV